MKKSVCLSAVVAVLLTGTVVWSQSTATGKPQSRLDRSSDLMRLLQHPGGAAVARATTPSSAGVAPMIPAHIYKFATVDYPGAPQTQATGNANGTAVGIFSYGPSGGGAFVFKGGVYSLLAAPGSLATIVMIVSGLCRNRGGYRV